MTDEQRQLARDYVPLAYSIAHRMRRHSDDVDEVQQDALLGLAQAAARFDPERGTAFSSFAHPYIEGVIKHGRRSRSWKNRAQWDGIEVDQRGKPTSYVHGFNSLDAEQVNGGLVSDMVGERDANIAGVDFRGMLDSLPARHRKALLLYFIWGFTQKEIAPLLNVSQMQISRILRQALTTLHARHCEDEEFDMALLV